MKLFSTLIILFLISCIYSESKTKTRNKINDITFKRTFPKPTPKKKTTTSSIKSKKDINILLNLPNKNDSIKPVSEKQLASESALYKHGMAIFKSALQNYMNGNYNESIKLFKDVIGIDPLHKNAYDYLNRATTELNKTNNPEHLEKKINDRNNYKNEIIFQSGLEPYLKGNYKVAINIWTAQTKTSPEFTKAFIYIKKAEEKLDKIVSNFISQGDFYFDKGNIPRAIKEWKSGLNFVPSNLNLKGKIEYAKSQETSLIEEALNSSKIKLEEDNFAEAVLILTNTLEKFPHSIIIKNKIDDINKKSTKHIAEKIDIAKKLFKDKKYKEARKVFKTILIINPKNTIAKKYLIDSDKKYKLTQIRFKLLTDFKKGQLFLESGKYLEALDIFYIIREKDSEYPDLNDNITLALEKREKVKIRKEVSKAFNKGLKYFKKGYYKSALKEWNFVKKHDSKNKIVISYIKKLNEQMHGAVSRRKLKSVKEKEAFNLNKKALELYKKRDYKKSFETIKKANILDPSNEAVKKGLKAVRKELIKSEEKLIPENKKKIEKLFHEGINFYRSGKLKLAIKCWKKIILINPKHSTANRYIKNVQQKLEQIERI